MPDRAEPAVDDLAGAPERNECAIASSRTIDLQAWPRRHIFDHFWRNPCTYSITTQLDVTSLLHRTRAGRRRLYAVQVWSVAHLLNQHDEFKLTMGEDGRVRIWDRVDPLFTVFNESTETFSSLWAPFDPDFDRFQDVFTEVTSRHEDAAVLFPQGEPPPNTFDVSSLPWLPFDGFNLNISNQWQHLAPIITMGRHVERNGRRALPVAFQIHHAAADGFHTSRFLNDLQSLFDSTVWECEPPDS